MQDQVINTNRQVLLAGEIESHANTLLDSPVALHFEQFCS